MGPQVQPASDRMNPPTEATADMEPTKAHRLRPRSRRRHRRRHLPSMSVMATLCTLGNLVAGFAAIHYASMPPDFAGPWGWSGLTFAGALIFLGMLFDAVDGSIARLTRSTSEVGGQLDSLADMVTFGVAPAYIMLRLVGQHLADDAGVTIIGPEADDLLGKVLWAVAVVYVCCTGLRLARFNIEAASSRIERRGSFRGLPSPGAAGTVASLILLHQHLLVAKYIGGVSSGFVRGATLGIPLIVLLCAVAMVSSIPYVHFTNRYIRGPRSFAYVVRLVFPMALAVWWPQEILALLFTAYALSGPAQLVISRSRSAGGDADAPHPNE